MTLYRRLAGQDTDARKYLTCIPKALNYYRKSLLPDGRLARFYELGSNRPLYMNQQYKLTYENNDLPDHYAFIVSSKLERLTREYDEISVLPIDELWETPRSDLLVVPLQRIEKLQRFLLKSIHVVHGLKQGNLDTTANKILLGKSLKLRHSAVTFLPCRDGWGTKIHMRVSRISITEA